MASTIAERLRSAPPGLHGLGDEYWGLSWPALEWLERELRPGMGTLETGAGASTIVFATAGTTHEAVTPDAEEEVRIRATCAELGVPSTTVAFRIGSSHEVLPGLDDRELDVVLLDGAHGFPYPILDWWYVSPHVKEGGLVVLDDAYLPPVTAVLDFARSSSAWTIERSIGYRTVVIRKVKDGLPPFDWEGGRIGGRLSFRYLGPPERLLASARHRFFTTRVGLGLVGLYHRRSGLRWRKKG